MLILGQCLCTLFSGSWHPLVAQLLPGAWRPGQQWWMAALQPFTRGLISGNVILQRLCVQTISASPTCPLPPKAVLLRTNHALVTLHQGLLFFSEASSIPMWPGWLATGPLRPGTEANGALEGHGFGITVSADGIRPSGHSALFAPESDSLGQGWSHTGCANGHCPLPWSSSELPPWWG